jgi:diaminopimelate decarboxylase
MISPELTQLLSSLPTPFYAYDLGILSKNFESLKQALPNDFQILYSMKANPNPKILQALKELGAWIDVASLGELKMAQAAGFANQEISFVGPGKSFVELQTLARSNLFSGVIESIEELKRLDQLALENKMAPQVCLRIHPLREIGPSGQERAAGPSQFGIDEEQLPEIASAVQSLRAVRVNGLHFFTRSQFLRASEILNACERAFRLTEVFEDKLGKMEFVNLGGGFGIPYFENQEPLDLSELKTGLSSLVSKQRVPRKYLVESGRYIAGESGTFVTKILYKKISRGRTYLICDGGMSQNLSAVGVGQAIRRNFPISVIPSQPGKNAVLERVTIAGPSCYSIDVLGLDVELPSPQPGDHICIGQMGAYGYTFSPLKFLTQVDPQEVCIGR